MAESIADAGVNSCQTNASPRSEKARKPPRSVKVFRKQTRKAPMAANRKCRFSFGTTRPKTHGIRKKIGYGKESKLLIHKSVFARLCRQLVADMTGYENMRFETSAIAAMQLMAEGFLVSYCEDLRANATHDYRRTVQAKDSKLAKSYYWRFAPDIWPKQHWT